MTVFLFDWFGFFFKSWNASGSVSSTKKLFQSSCLNFSSYLSFCYRSLKRVWVVETRGHFCAGGPKPAFILVTGCYLIFHAEEKW